MIASTVLPVSLAITLIIGHSEWTQYTNHLVDNYLLFEWKGFLKWYGACLCFEDDRRQNTSHLDATTDARAYRIWDIVTRSEITVCVHLKVKVGHIWTYRNRPHVYLYFVSICENSMGSKVGNPSVVSLVLWSLLTEPWTILQSFRESLGIFVFSQMELGRRSLAITT